jgi:hypothetical protein
MKTKGGVFFMVVVFLNVSSLKSQSNDAEAALYNIGFGAVFSTVGAILNKKPEDDLGKIIKKSLWQGALGGYITFESKRMLRAAQQQHKWEYVWAAKLANAMGTSVKENAAFNRDFWEKWHLNIGFNRLEFTTKDNFSVHYKFMPVAFVFAVDALARHQFEWKKSWQTGEFVFSTAQIKNNEFINVGASTFPGLILFEKSVLNDIQLYTHEIVHLYQSNDFSVMNAYVHKTLKKGASKSKPLKWVHKYMYPEFHYLILRPAYLWESKNIQHYYDNFFEHEAGYYSGTLPRGN